MKDTAATTDTCCACVSLSSLSLNFLSASRFPLFHLFFFFLPLNSPFFPTIFSLTAPSFFYLLIKFGLLFLFSDIVFISYLLPLNPA